MAREKKATRPANRASWLPDDPNWPYVDLGSTDAFCMATEAKSRHLERYSGRRPVVLSRLAGLTSQSEPRANC